MPNNHREKKIIRIGLMRHFPVTYKLRKFSSSAMFDQDMEAYNTSPVTIINTNSDSKNWSICYTSNMKRADETGRHIFKGEIKTTPLLREVPLQAGFKTNLKLPLFFWATLGRIQWLFNSEKQPETKKMSLNRAKSFISELNSNLEDKKNILIISHGFFMMNLKKELYRAGFRGRNFMKAKHGIIYSFEKIG
jgi:hypothetical protein